MTRLLFLLCAALFLAEATLCATERVVLEKRASKGDAFAQCQLGLMYASGRGVPQDEAQAVEWLQKAALQGNAFAQSTLG